MLWLSIAYPLSVGPVAYATERGWASPGSPAAAFVNPAFRLAEAMPSGASGLFTRYADWWAEVAYSHLDAASD